MTSAEHAEYSRQWRLRNKQHVRLYLNETIDRRSRQMAAWRAAHPDKLLEYSRLHAHDNPEKQTARRKLQWAVRSGKLIRPDECGRCFRPGKTEAHHHDYAQPLSVAWLCKRCHEVVEHYGFS